MNTRFVLTVAVVVAVALVSPAHGATEQGMIELNGSATFVAAVGEYAPDVSVYTISTQVTRFATDAFSLGGRLTFEGTTIGDHSLSVLGMYAVADVHLAPTQTFVPFLGGAFGFERWAVDGSDDTEFLVEFHGGGKAFIRDNVAVTMEARYRTTMEDFGDVGEFSLLAGLSVFLF